MEYHDRVLKCADCSAEFVFTAGEQMFFADKGYERAQAVQKLQSETGARRQRCLSAGRFLTIRNENHLLAVRERNYSSLQADSGQARFLPRMFSAAARDGPGNGLRS